MYDKKCMLSITINGQLMLLMLCEKLIKIGVKVDMCNTDGITIIYKKHLHDQVEKICDDWQKMTRMELETVKYLKVVRMNINNYMAFYEGGIKYKGMFLTDPPIDQSRDHLVIAKALFAHYGMGIGIEEFIKGHKEIYDFCACKKVDKKYEVFWNDIKQQRLNRYYVCKQGPYLYKSKNDSREHLMKDHPVQLYNDQVQKEDYGIDHSYYISETKKLMNELSGAQLKIF